MQVGDLVRLAYVVGGTLGNLRGIILKIYSDPHGEPDDLKASVFWTDGDHTEEWYIDLEPS